MVAWWLLPATRYHIKEVTVIQSTAPSARDQIDSLRDQFQHEQGLPFLDLLSQTLAEDMCRQGNYPWRNRSYTPWITLGLFLSQVLADGQSCDEAVDRFQKYRCDRGLPAVSTETTSYCEARQRLPEDLIWDLVRRTGQTIHQRARTSWLFH